MPLTDVAIRNAKPRDKPYKVGDTLGLFLLVQPSGGKLWRVKYRIDGKEKKLAIGIYPQVGLAEARRRRDAARELVAAGKDPGREKQREKVRSRIQAETTFDAIAAEFCQKRRRDGQKAWAVSTATRSEYLLSLLKGSIGKLPITDIEPADVLAAVRKIERKGQLESRLATLKEAVSRHERLNRALRVGRCPTLLVAILQRFEQYGLSPHLLTVGTHALYAYEAAAGVRFHRAQGQAGALRDFRLGQVLQVGEFDDAALGRAHAGVCRHRPSLQ